MPIHTFTNGIPLNDLKRFNLIGGSSGTTETTGTFGTVFAFQRLERTPDLIRGIELFERFELSFSMFAVVRLERLELAAQKETPFTPS